MLSVVVLISGSGSNLRALLEAAANPLNGIRVLAVGADNPATGLEHAEFFNIPTFVVAPQNFESRQAWSDVLLENVKFYQPDLVVLAGFMRILPSSVVDALSPNLINIHPSILPAFPGAHAVRDALRAGVKTTGATVHVVDAGVDTGPIIRQTEIQIPDESTEESLHEIIRSVESQQLIDVVRDIADGKIKLGDLR